ncbi:GNAT family N-acetyltransferase [Luteimonas abyssi]|uniref:GNAT family N-acetyltransferase n=1 Tax=Luteimonas abyssi TaxID=1247514 RepID=UPI000737C886|nr:GNAT family N-acetyltransferase [Luteimonas abyssi]
MTRHDATWPELRTERLLLRVPRMEDFERYAEVIGNPDAARYIGGHQPRAAAWRRFLQMPGAWMVQGFGMFSVIEAASGRWLGQAGPWQPDGWPGAEVGYTFHPDAWGQGYASEAATAAIDWAFDHLGWDEVIHCIDPDNAASQALAHRLGSRRLRRARLPAPFEDDEVEVWGQTRAQWRARDATDA